MAEPKKKCVEVCGKTGIKTRICTDEQGKLEEEEIGTC